MKTIYITAVLFGSIVLSVTVSNEKRGDGKIERSMQGATKVKKSLRARQGLTKENYLMYFCEWKMCESTKMTTTKDIKKCKRFRRCHRKHLISYHCHKRPKMCEDNFSAKGFTTVCKYCFENNIISIHDLRKRKELPTKSKECHKARSCLHSRNGYKNRYKRRNNMIKVICAKKIIDKYNLHPKCAPTQLLRQKTADKSERWEYLTSPQTSASQFLDSTFVDDVQTSLELSTSSAIQPDYQTSSISRFNNRTPFMETVITRKESNFEEIDKDEKSNHEVNKIHVLYIVIGICVSSIIFIILPAVIFKIRRKVVKELGPMNNVSVHYDTFGKSLSTQVGSSCEIDWCSTSETDVTNQILVEYERIGTLVKGLEIPACNDYSMLAKSESTQTKITNVPKSIYKQPWQTSSYITHLGGILQTAGSDVSLVVSSGTVEKMNDLHIYGRVHVDLQMLTESLGLEEQYICSPAPEYHMDGDWKSQIKKHMVIHLPYVMPWENAMNLPIVYTFYLDEGKITKSPIPLKASTNHDDDLPDTFYEIDVKNKMIYIYTRHFCGFIACCGCNDFVQCSGTLNAKIFGKSKMINNRREVRIRYVVWDHKGSIADFQNKYLLERDDFQLLESMGIELSEKMTESTMLTFKMKVLNDKSNAWQCLGDGDEIFFPLKKSVELKKLFSCCRTRPYFIDWVMTRRCSKTSEYDFGCIISITDDTSVDEDEQVNKQPCYIDNVPDDSIIWQRRETGDSDTLIDILKRELTPRQVQIISRESQFERCPEIDEDLRRNPTEASFMEKWVKELWSSEQFQDKMMHYLKMVNADSVITEMKKIRQGPFFKNLLSSLDSSISSENNNIGIVEPQPHFFRSRSPCENSDDDFEPIFGPYDTDQTHVKYLETEI